MLAAPPKAGEAEFSELLEVGCIAFGVCDVCACLCGDGRGAKGGGGCGVGFQQLTVLKPGQWCCPCASLLGMFKCQPCQT